MISKESAYKELDQFITHILKNTSVEHWDEILDAIHQISAKENRLFINPYHDTKLFWSKE